MCRQHPEAAALQFVDRCLDCVVPDQSNPLGRARGGVRMNLKSFLGGDRVSLQHSNRVTVTEDGREIVALMNVLHEHCEIWLPPA